MTWMPQRIFFLATEILIFAFGLLKGDRLNFIQESKRLEDLLTTSD
jgi:hypothetical protein